ncbi:MAG: RNA polymerase subunit sigma-24 [Sphingobacteriales bacterium 17-39-43]|uniref:RNA polymerase sigma factor n=1 Tax=Daejeonella sp. TaxID=2805397 RepID=UPI000BC6026C|nr:sigma-70 family RNA polymerase sigma factor [Daejeonella sp.]OYZ33192.1 MAG: RNA polymerase subunit sigma-24 [Sphingobacteriales bacterium 16-39-50]OYZ56187.1 MAG: RNA polymerase subunit sigma-24 [Sphingobacteriales bacterium 24-40-4]OZA26601.1 MAG: RNA polymerase subunit sigma-24 [Sphingobacteriales bacterium 17-39-43]HQS05361.1 sigma-70 family RNA polymerase sigma factor [Daejeonella sp.]HQS51946.1 sigma-70 family RNA polymerase sigma factor [Daejeonella sp.]
MEINPNFSANAKNDFMLVIRARDGDQKAYAELMQRYKDSIYFMALKMVNHKDDAMDLTVETFGKAFENIEKYKPDFAFSTWLFRIATNNCIDFIRKKRLNVVSLQSLSDEDKDEKQLQIASDALNPEQTSIKKQESEKLKSIVEQLPQRYRTLIILRYYDEQSYEEIAQQLDLPLGTVKAQLFRARDLMSNIMNRRKKNLRSDF